MGSDNNGQPEERVQGDGKTLGGEPSNLDASEQLAKEEANDGNHEKDSSKRICVYGVESVSSPGGVLVSARSATGIQDAVVLGELQTDPDSAYNDEIGSPSHSGQQGTPPSRQQTNSTGALGGSRNSSSGGTPRRLRPIAPKGDSPHMSVGGPGKNSPRNGAPSGKRKPCNCKQSRCLKLYCECFASGVYCKDCNCVNCHNNPQHEEDRQEAVNATLERDSNAFRNKITIAQRNQRTVKNLNISSMGIAQSIQSAVVQGVHTKGCNCKKSHCLKKYCECFQANIYCGDNCKCTCCKNFEGSEERRLLYEDPTSPLTMSPSKRPRYPATVNSKAAALMAGHSSGQNPSLRSGIGSPPRHIRDSQALGSYRDTSSPMTYLSLAPNDSHTSKTALAEILTPDRLVLFCKKLLDAANNEGLKYDQERGKAQEEPNSGHTAVDESKEAGGNSSKDDAKSLLEELECDEDDEFINDGNEEDEEERMPREDLSERFARQERVIYEEFGEILEKLLSEIQQASGSTRQEDLRAG